MHLFPVLHPRPPAARRRCGQRHSQQGITFVGLLFIMGLVGLIGFAGLKLIPVYLNYMKVAKNLDATAAEFKGETTDPASVRRSLEKHWQIDDIENPEVKQVEVLKDEGGLSLHVTYDDSAPYIANVSLTVHFDKTVKMQ